MTSVDVLTDGTDATRRAPSRRILVVDDDEDVQKLLVQRLEPDGFHVEQARDGESALVVLRSDIPDLVVLDLVLPDLNGIEILVSLRRHSDVPVIVLSGKRSESDRVVGLELGADDYVVKPFSTRELAARIRGILRRATHQERDTRLEFGGLSIDVLAREVRVNGELVPTTEHEFDLLLHLSTSPRRVFTREQLLQAVWDSSAEWQDDATVTEYIHRVRHKIETDPRRPRHIITVWGVGYRFER